MATEFFKSFWWQNGHKPVARFSPFASPAAFKGDKSFYPFFIVGCPRSGTTLLQVALSRHSQIIVPPETSFFAFLGAPKNIQSEHWERIRDDLGIKLPCPRSRICRYDDARGLFEEMVRQYLLRLGKGNVTHFGEKSPEHLSHIGRIAAVFPDAKIILIYRDGRDVALSLLRLPWTSRDIYVNFALWLYCYRLQKRAQRFCALPLLCIRYEDIVQDPEDHFRHILRFLGLPYESQVANGDGNLEVIPMWEYPWKRRAADRISSNRVGLWRAHLSAKQIEVMERWGGSALSELGYKLDTDGSQQLPWFFYPQVAWNSLSWLICKPRFGQGRRLLAEGGDRFLNS